MSAAQRRNDRCVDGLLLLDKPVGMSSNAALQRARRCYGARSAGHGGTLDPLASGLLPLLFGEATKFSSDVLEGDKAYRATVAFGVRTDTGDAEGEVLSRAPADVSRATLDAVLERFRGPIAQIPPMHSALKRDGKPLYAYARAGQTVERASRQVVIRDLRVVEATADRAVLDVVCTKGTYIRTLAEDIGEALGCGAHLTALRRTRAGHFSIESAIAPEALESADEAQRLGFLLPLAKLVAHLPEIALDAAQARRFCQGQPLPGEWPTGDRLAVYTGNALLGLGKSSPEGVLKPRRVLHGAASSALLRPCEEP